MPMIVITHPDLDDARGVIDREALPEFAAVGWIELGEASGVPGSTQTLDEEKKNAPPSEESHSGHSRRK